MRTASLASSRNALLPPSSPMTLAPATSSYAVRSAASMTPPVAPNSAAAPVPAPGGVSNSEGGSDGSGTY